MVSPQMSLVERVPLSRLVALSFICLLLLIFCILFFISVEVRSISEATSSVDSGVLPTVLDLDEMNLRRSEVQQFLTDVSATRDTGAYKDAEEAAIAFRIKARRVVDYFERTGRNRERAEVEKILREFEEFYQTGRLMANEYLTRGTEAGNVLMKGSESVPGFDGKSEVLLNDLTILRERFIEFANRSTAESADRSSSLLYYLFGVGAFAVALSVLLSLLIARTIRRQLDKAVQSAQLIASGVLNPKGGIFNTTEVGLLLRSLTLLEKNLNDIVCEIDDVSLSLTDASGEIEGGSNKLALRAKDQLLSIRQIGTSMDQLAEKIVQNNDSVIKAKALAVDASNCAASGGNVVNEVMQTMSDIDSSSKQIAAILSVIDGIAFQTNILALNAAVEAARAGDLGRGFAVVASEVRSLAGMSADAAKKIKLLIDASTSKIEHGNALTREAGRTMSQIMYSIQSLTGLVGEISSASNMQSVEVKNIRAAMNTLNSSAAEDSNLVTQLIGQTDNLAHLSTLLKDKIALFSFQRRLPGFE